MNVDCQWISKNLEALFCDGLTDEQHQLAGTYRKLPDVPK